MKSYKQKHYGRGSEINLLYLEDRPDLDQEGTELTWEDVYEDGVEEEFDVAGGFDPANPVYLCNEGYTYEDECQELVTQEDLDAEIPDIDQPWDEDNYEFYEDTWNEVYVFHETGAEDVPENYVSFQYDDHGNYIEADPEELEYEDDE